MTGLEPVPVAVDERGLDVAALDAHDVAAVLVAPAHSYPIGATLDPGRRRDLVAWARRHDALIIEDDYDAELRYDRFPIGALQGLAPDHVVYLGSASQDRQPGAAARLARGPPPTAALEREKRLDDMGSGLLEQLAFARFADRGDFARYLRRVRPIYRARATRRAALQARLPEVRHQGAAAGLHLHVTLPAGVDERALAPAAADRGALVEEAACTGPTRGTRRRRSSSATAPSASR